MRARGSSNPSSGCEGTRKACSAAPALPSARAAPASRGTSNVQSIQYQYRPPEVFNTNAPRVLYLAMFLPDLNVNLHTNRVLQTHSRTSTTSRETHNRTHRNSPTHVNPSREHQGSATFTHTHSLTHVALTHSRRISPAPSATSPARLIALDVALLELEEVRVRRVWRVVRMFFGDGD